MAYDAATMALVEDALSECFKYHASLDSFLQRSGIHRTVLHKARARAEQRTIESGRFAKAPKRFVAQEILIEIAQLGPDGDKLVANIITGLLKSDFRDAAEPGLTAVAGLRTRIDLDRQEKEERRRIEREEHAKSERATERAREAKVAGRIAARDALRSRFEDLCKESEAQRRGYKLERFLNDLFEHEGLDPRGSFRLTGEQIDGSFYWRNRTCLVEAKWVKQPVAGAEFGAFNYKIEGKTLDTRGVYISINGYSGEAIEGMKLKGALKFVCLDGTHIMYSLLSELGLPYILERVWRHADETGESYLPASRL